MYASGTAEPSNREATAHGKSKANSKPQHGGWSLWRSIKQSFADEPTESSRASIISKVRMATEPTFVKLVVQQVLFCYLVLLVDVP